MQRRSSSSSSLGQTRRRKVSLTLRTDPDGYARGGGRSVGRLVWSRLGSLGSPGWDVHPVARMGSRYSIGKEAYATDGVRKSWVDKVVKEKQWVPGPGSHATERSFVSDQNEFDAKRCVEELRPDYSFGKAIWEPALKEADRKLQRNSFRHPKFDQWFTPGPGTHTQFTVFDGRQEPGKLPTS
eukprot:symbB.v1.2.038456.t1/scaffold5996.1/size21896/3